MGNLPSHYTGSHNFYLFVNIYLIYCKSEKGDENKNEQNRFKTK